MDMSRGRQGRCGRPNALTDPWEMLSITRTSYRKWAVKSGIPSLWRLCKRVGPWKHKRWVKPALPDKQKRDRVGFVLSHMLGREELGWWWTTCTTGSMWMRSRFYVMKDGRGISLHPEEDLPKRAQNKRFIKVMFLAAVARPRMISDGVWFDGKIGTWPIADTVAAMLSRKNRKKGTMMLKPATVNAERYKALMIDKAIPAIKARMPRPPGHTSLCSRMVRSRTGGGWA
ncbi:unnamed protein product [Discosporangium mesarthrocarpum]